MEFLLEYGLFLAKALTILVVVVMAVGLIVSMSQRSKKHSDKGHLEVTRLNDRFEDAEETLLDAVMEHEERKQILKARHKQEKAEAKARRKALKKKSKQPAADNTTSDSQANEGQDGQSAARARVYVLNFDGDIKASAVDNLREEVSGILSLARPEDEVVVRLESGGGMVHSYGLASSQLDRIRKQKIPLTVCVDKVAASGGYMMASVADKILAAPFAMLGSIGVIAQLPNFHRLLKHHHVDFEMLTAGEHKRTLTMFGENTDKGRAKFVEDLEDIHDLFKTFVGEHRPAVPIEEVANGDVWFGRRALDKKLVDELMTSDEYIHRRAKEADVFEVEFVFRKTIQEKLGMAAEGTVDRLLLKWLSRVQNSRFFT